MSSTYWNISPECILTISDKSLQKINLLHPIYFLIHRNFFLLKFKMQCTNFFNFMLRGACRVSQVVIKVLTYYSLLPNTHVRLRTHCDPIISWHFGDFLQSVSLLNFYLKESIWVDPLNCFGNRNTWFVFILFFAIWFNWLNKSAQNHLWMTNRHLDISLLLSLLCRTCRN